MTDVLAEALNDNWWMEREDQQWPDAASLIDLLAARGYALVRTPETLDDDDPEAWRMRTVKPSQSPTPPEGLRAALEQALEEHRNQDGLMYSSTCWCIAAEAALAASPAPDPGAELTGDIEVDPWPPSAEPPETT